MTTKKPQGSKTKSKRGGARPGAGRPKKDRRTAAPTAGQTAGQTTFETAEQYLQAVVEGTAPADPVRVRAAACLIRYQQTAKRAPKKSPTPTQLDRTEKAAVENAIVEDFETKAAEIRKRHREKAGNG